eukprot:SAG25_NODE_119_length_14756_cov_696.499898_5_plen_439_part_00
MQHSGREHPALLWAVTLLLHLCAVAADGGTQATERPPPSPPPQQQQQQQQCAVLANERQYKAFISPPPFNGLHKAIFFTGLGSSTLCKKLAAAHTGRLDFAVVSARHTRHAAALARRLGVTANAADAAAAEWKPAGASAPTPKGKKGITRHFPTLRVVAPGDVEAAQEVKGYPGNFSFGAFQKISDWLEEEGVLAHSTSASIHDDGGGGGRGGRNTGDGDGDDDDGDGDDGDGDGDDDDDDRDEKADAKTDAPAEDGEAAVVDNGASGITSPAGGDFEGDEAPEFGEIATKGRKAKGYRDQRLLAELPSGMGPRAYMDLLHTNCIQERIQVRTLRYLTANMMWALTAGRYSIHSHSLPHFVLAGCVALLPACLPARRRAPARSGAPTWTRTSIGWRMPSWRCSGMMLRCDATAACAAMLMHACVFARHALLHTQGVQA